MARSPRARARSAATIIPLQPDTDLRRARDPRLDGMEAVACGNQAGALIVAHREMQAIAWISDRFSQADIGVQRADPAGVQFNDLVRLYPISGPNSSIRRWRSFSGSRALFLSGRERLVFTRAFDLHRLMAEQAKTSRSTAVFVGRNLRLSGVRAGDPSPADPALHVSEWIARYAQRDGASTASARRGLVRQSGAEWKGRGAASPAVRCMLAAFALHGAERRDEARGFSDSCRRACPSTRPKRRRPEAPLAFIRRRLLSRFGSWRSQGFHLGRRDHGRASFYHAGPHVVLNAARRGTASCLRRSSCF